MASTSNPTDPTGFPSVAVTSAAPPSEYAVTAKEPAPAAPPVPGMGTDAHSAQEALDKVAQEPSFLGKVANMAQPYLVKMDAVAQPYVEKVQSTTKPYTDAAAVKARELIDKIEGPGSAVPGTTTSAAELGADGATSGTPTLAERRGSKGLGPETYGAAGAPSAGTLGSGEKSSIFDTITKTVTDLGHKVDEKTASADKPGLFTQLTSAVQRVTDKADAYIGSHAPTATNATSVAGHPVQTTTNTIPHTDKPDFAAQQPVVPPASSSAAAGVNPVGAGAVPVVPAVSGGAPVGAAAASGVPSAQV